MVLLICPSGKTPSSFRGAPSWREPGIHNHRCLLSTATRPQLRATSAFVVMDSGPAPSGASRNDGGVSSSAKAGIQYAAALRFDHRRHGILGRPLSRAMTAGVCGCPTGKNHHTLVIPGREAKRREPGIHNHRCLLSTAQRPQLRATSAFVAMDSGPAPSGASRNDQGGARAKRRAPDDGYAIPPQKTLSAPLRSHRGFPRAGSVRN